MLDIYIYIYIYIYILYVRVYTAKGKWPDGNNRLCEPREPDVGKEDKNEYRGRRPMDRKGVVRRYLKTTTHQGNGQRDKRKQMTPNEEKEGKGRRW